MTRYCQVLGMVLINCVCALIPKCISQDLTWANFTCLYLGIILSKKITAV